MNFDRYHINEVVLMSFGEERLLCKNTLAIFKSTLSYWVDEYTKHT